MHKIKIVIMLNKFLKKMQFLFISKFESTFDYNY